MSSCKSLQSFLQHGNKVLIKPNLLAPAPPEQAVTTHPSVVKATIETAQEAGAEVFVGDSSMQGPLQEVLQVSGILNVINETGAKMLPFQCTQEAYLENAIICSSFPVSKEALEMDVIINVAKLKTHTLTGISAAVKNCFGFVVGSNKKRFHFRFPLKNHFSDMLIDLYLLTKPEFSIIDAVIAMEGLGPRNGRPRPVGAIIASNNAVAADAVAAKLVGFSTNEVSTLESAARHNIDGYNISKIEVNGPLDSLLVHDFNKGAGGKGWSFLWRYLPAVIRNINERNRPWPVIGSKCIACGLCQEHCPAEAITYDKNSGSTFLIRYENCIRCFCCHEVCPQGAVEFK